MFKKSFLAIMLVAIGIFAVSTAHANGLDGLASISTGAVTASDVIPTGLTADTTLHMYVNPGGLGDALIYGYYNARNAWDLIRVVNTSTTQAIGAKVRFREGRNSNEVLDFAICLSAGDQFTAWVVGDSNPANPARLVWWDNDTPTYPDPNGDNDVTNNKNASQNFKFAPDAVSSVTADDTKEGYLEIIGARAWWDTVGVDTPEKCRTAIGISGGTALSACANDGTGFCPVDVPNVLFGNLYIFNVGNIVAGTGMGTYAYNATALANFRSSDIYNTQISISLASDSQPKLTDSFPDVNGNGTGLDEVNYVLTKYREFATYDIESDFGGVTTIINTFPTKKWTIATDDGLGAPIFETVNSNGPFNDDAKVCADGKIGTYDANTSDNCSTSDTSARCEEVFISLWDDKEHNPTTTTGFSPGETTKLEKCDEVTLISIGADSDVHSKPLIDSNLSWKLNNASFTLGWIVEDFVGTKFDRYTEITPQDTSSHYVTYGLPVISYELQGIAGSFLTHMLPLRYEEIQFMFNGIF